MSSVVGPKVACSRNRTTSALVGCGAVVSERSSHCSFIAPTEVYWMTRAPLTGEAPVTFRALPL